MFGFITNVLNITKSPTELFTQLEDGLFYDVNTQRFVRNESYPGQNKHQTNNSIIESKDEANNENILTTCPANIDQKTGDKIVNGDDEIGDIVMTPTAQAQGQVETCTQFIRSLENDIDQKVGLYFHIIFA